MAQPQGLNVPAIATTGIVTVLLTGIIVEGVRALYAYEEPREEARKSAHVLPWNTHSCPMHSNPIPCATPCNP
jgi:hypothetical protein